MSCTRDHTTTPGSNDTDCFSNSKRLIAATTRSTKAAAKRKKGSDRNASPGKKQKHGSSGHVFTSSSSSPIVAVNNSSSASRRRSFVVPPPVWSSDEEDELESENDRAAETDDDAFEARQKSSQLTDKEKKVIAMKRLKKARKDKGERFPYYSPIKKSRSKNENHSTTKAKLNAHDSDDFDELASQIPASNSDALAPMPWESDEEGNIDSGTFDEPVYEEKEDFQAKGNLPPPLPQPEKVWNRKIRPSSRRDLFEATQRPPARSPSPILYREESDGLSDLNLRTSSSTKYESTPQKATAVTAEPYSAKIAPATSSVSRHRDHTAGRPSTVQRSPSRTPSDGIQELPVEALKDAQGEPTENDLPPLNGIDEPLYWEDNSFMEGDFSIGEDDLHMANLRPFFTPSPPGKARSPLPMPGPATMELDKLIAAAEEQAEKEQAVAQFQANSAEASTSAAIARKAPTEPLEKAASSAELPSQTNGHLQDSKGLDGSSDRPISRTDKGKQRETIDKKQQDLPMQHIDTGKGRAIVEDVQEESKINTGSPQKSAALVSDEEEWSDFDELELTQVSRRNTYGRQGSNSTPKRNVSSSSVKRGAKEPLVEAGPSKLPSSEEESQACSFCGNIYPIGSLPTHVEACQAAQISAAAASHAHAGTKSKGIFRYNEEPGSKSNPFGGPRAASPPKQKGSLGKTVNGGPTQEDQLEALLFGQPIIKARQIQDSPPRRDKGKGRATDDSEDDLTSPDVPLRQIRSTHRPSSRPRQTTVEDLVESDGRASASRPNAHNWKAGQSAQSRSRPIRAPDPHSQSAVEVEDDMQDVGSSPPTGSIFISQLPKNIRKGYYRLLGLDDEGQIASLEEDQIIQKRKPLPDRGAPRGGWFTRGRGRGRAPTSKSSRGGKTKSRKK